MSIPGDFRWFSKNLSTIFLVFLFQAQQSLSQNLVDNTLSVTPAVNDFVVKLISSHFQNCSLLVLEDFEDNGQNVDYILQNLLLSTYLVKFQHLQNQTSQNTTIHLPVTFPVKMSKVRRLSKQCVMSVLYINKIESDLMTQIKEVIAPTYIPITRKDEDHYIFVSENKHHEKLLLMYELPHRTKFKIAVGENPSSPGEVSISTSDFFGGPNAAPQILPLSENEPDFFPDFFWDLNGKVLQVSLPLTLGLVESYYPPTIRNGKRGRWTYLLEEFLMIKFNFTYRMFLSTGKDGNFGSGGTGFQLPNGTWIGITGDLHSGKADMGLGMTNTVRRAYYIGFTDSYFDIGCLAFATGQPDKIFSPLALFWPFNTELWLCLGASTLIGLIFFYSVVKLTSYSFKHVLFEQPGLSNVFLQLQILIFPYIEQDSPKLPDSNSLRCFISLWAFFTLIITNLYRSKLVELLAFPVVEKVPETFQQLAFSEYKVGFMKHGDASYNTLKSSTDPVYVKLVMEMEIIPGGPGELECLEKVVKNTKYGCILFDFAFSHLREKNFSDADARQLIRSRDTTFTVWLPLATEANSIYRINFGKAIAFTMPHHLAIIWNQMDLHENVRQLKLQWWTDTNQTENFGPGPEESSDLTLQHLTGAFYTLFCGCATSLVFFLWEQVIFHVKLCKCNCC